MLALQSLDKKFNKIFIRKRGNENFIRQNFKFTNKEIKILHWALSTTFSLEHFHTTPLPHFRGEVTRVVIIVMILYFII